MDAEIRKFMDRLGIEDMDGGVVDIPPPIPVDLAKLRAYYRNELSDVESDLITQLITRYKAWNEASDQIIDEEAGEAGEGVPDRHGKSPGMSAETPYAIALDGNGGDEAYHTTFKASAAECEWTPDRPTSVSEEDATIDIRWEDDGFLRVTVGGFLRVSPEHRLECVWYTGDGTERGRGACQNPFVPVLDIRPQDSRPPLAKDELHLVNAYEPAGETEWQVEVRVRLL